jgi:hypothetical protein
MGDCRPLEEMLFQYFLSHYPTVLNEEEVFDKLLLVIHGLLRRAARMERERMMAQMRKVSSC